MLEMAQQSIPWKIIAPPKLLKDPVYPEIPRNLALGLFLATVFGVSAGLIRDSLDIVFHNKDEVEEDLKVPILGEIPYVSLFRDLRDNKENIFDVLSKAKYLEKDESKNLKYELFFYQEAFRNLFTSIRFLNTENNNKSFIISSAIPSEGKTLINVLLAKTLSEMGYKVLLIDADMRRPKIHQRLGLDNISGLSNLLTDDKLSYKDVINEIEGHKNWKVLTSGIKPPDPPRLITSEKMKRLVKELNSSQDFDYIIYDTPPLIGLSDSILLALSESISGLILLVSLKQVNKQLPKDAIKRILSSNVNFLGIILNSKMKLNTYNGRYGYDKDMDMDMDMKPIVNILMMKD